MSFQIPTLTEILDELIDRTGDDLGVKFTIADVTNGVATATTTEADVMRGGTNAPTSKYATWFLWVPGLVTEDEQVRTVTGFSVSGTAATFTVNRAYAATAAAQTAYLIKKPTPSRLVALLNDALRCETFLTTVPLTEPVDGDMQTSGVSNWTPSAGTPGSKVTTAANVPFELAQSMFVNNANANDYMASTAVRIPRGQTLYIWAIVRADIGTATLWLVDSSGTAIDNMTTTQEEWMFIWKQITPTSTIEEVVFRLGAAGAGDDSYWGGVGFLSPGACNFVLPSWMAERWQFRALSIARFPVAGSASGEELARSRQLERLEEGTDFRLYFPEGAANPAWVELNADYTGYPLFLSGLRPYADIDTLSVTDLTTTTRCNLNLVVARAMHLLGQGYPDEYGRYYNQGIIEADVIRRGQRTDQPKKQRERFVFGWPN